MTLKKATFKKERHLMKTTLKMKAQHKNERFLLSNWFNPLVPDAQYSEHQDKPFSLQIHLLLVDLKLNCAFLFFTPRGTNGLTTSLTPGTQVSPM